ncbi:MAG: LLM class F420-dependent oxidoreductase [Chloroflexota bacterium]
MRYGVNLPLDATTLDPRALRDYAQAVEGMGYSYLMGPDHILAVDMTKRGTADYTPEMNTFREPFTTLGYLAGCTTNLLLGVGVLVVTQRQTTLVAKQAAEVDVLSGGRLRLGLGVGWSQEEFRQLGVDFSTRGRMMDEQIQVLNALWSQESVSFHGEFHHISEAGINPLPVQRPIPLWIGGTADPVLRRAARFGRGWLPERRPEPELQERFDRVRALLREERRDGSDFDLEGRVPLRSRSPEVWAKDLEMWRRLGVTGVSVTTQNAGCATIQDHVTLLRQFKEMVG